MVYIILLQANLKEMSFTQNQESMALQLSQPLICYYLLGGRTHICRMVLNNSNWLRAQLCVTLHLKAHDHTKFYFKFP